MAARTVMTFGELNELDWFHEMRVILWRNVLSGGTMGSSGTPVRVVSPPDVRAKERRGGLLLSIAKQTQINTAYKRTAT